MSKKLTIQVSEKTYSALQQKAKKEGISLADLIRRKIEPRRASRKASKKLSEDEIKKAHEELMKLVGSIEIGHPDGADNEAIDRDLAREYGRGLQWD